MIRAHHEDRPHVCAHCGEPVIRLVADGFGGMSRWLHTPNRLPCIHPLTREETGSIAEPRTPVIVAVDVRLPPRGRRAAA